MRSNLRGPCALLCCLLAVLGLLTPSGFGLVPLGGHDVWLHAVMGGILTAVGLLGSGRMVTRT